MTHGGDYQPETEVAAGELRSFVERIETIEAEIKDRNGDKSEIYKEAKSRGFDVKALRKIVAERRADPSELSELEAIMALYRGALA